MRGRLRTASINLLGGAGHFAVVAQGQVRDEIRTEKWRASYLPAAAAGLAALSDELLETPGWIDILVALDPEPRADEGDEEAAVPM
jgi:hypothetical protein